MIDWCTHKSYAQVTSHTTTNHTRQTHISPPSDSLICPLRRWLIVWTTWPSLLKLSKDNKFKLLFFFFDFFASQHPHVKTQPFHEQERERLWAQSDNLDRMAFWIKVAIARRFLFCLAAKECTREKKVQFCSLLIKGQYIFIMVGLGEMKNGYILCFGVSPSPPYPPTYLPTYPSIDRARLAQTIISHRQIHTTILTISSHSIHPKDPLLLFSHATLTMTDSSIQAS